MPGRAAYISNISYWIGDITGALDLLAGIPAKQDTPASGDIGPGENAPEPAAELDMEILMASITAPVSVLNGAGIAGLGKDAAEALQKIGIDVAHIGNAKHFDYRTTTIQYPEKGSEGTVNTARALGEIAGVDKKLITKSSAVPNVTLIIGKDKEKVLKRFGSLAAK